jgi:hypothetical protein
MKKKIRKKKKELRKSTSGLGLGIGKTVPFDASVPLKGTGAL